MHHKWQSYNVWFLRYGVWRIIFFFILDRFLLFYPPKNRVNQNLEKPKKKKNAWRYSFYKSAPKIMIICYTVPEDIKTPGDIIILYLCTINYNHMMNGSWDMECDGQNFFSFWTIFCPFNPLTTQKIKILKNWKKCLEVLSFYTCVP